MRNNHSHNLKFSAQCRFLILILIPLALSCAGLAWNEAVRKDTILDYEKFIGEHPKSAHEAECKAKIDALYQNPAKVAEKGYTLWTECMKEDRPLIDSIEEKYKKLISDNSAENQKAVNDIRKEVLAGKKICEKLKEVCEEFKNNVCSKTRKEKYTDFGCLNYWEGKEKEASLKIKKLEQDYTTKNKELSQKLDQETNNQTNLSREKCQKHINKDVFIYYPGIKIFYPESIP